VFGSTQYGICDRLHLLELRDVSRNGRCLPTFIPDLLDKGVEPLLTTGADDDLGAFLSEPEGCLASYMPLEAPITTKTCSSIGFNFIVFLLSTPLTFKAESASEALVRPGNR